MSPDPEIHPPLCFVLVWVGQDEKKKGGPGGSPPAPASLMLSQLVVVEEDAFCVIVLSQKCRFPPFFASIKV